MVKRTDHPDMTSDVYRGHKAINQTNKDQLDHLHTLSIVSHAQADYKSLLDTQVF